MKMMAGCSDQRDDMQVERTRLIISLVPPHLQLGRQSEYRPDQLD